MQTQLPATPLAARARLAYALDYPTLEAARQGAERVSPSVGVLKVGLELFVKEGPAAVRMAQELGCEVFLDLKLMDIPETVSRAVRAAGALGVRYLTLHAAGGRRMLEAARHACERENTGLQLLAVSVLTSLDATDLADVGVSGSVSAQVLRLAQLATAAGVAGLVCSAGEVPELRERLGERPLLVTPGIRPADADPGDQKRIATPRQAIAAGASMLVVGRPIRDAADPAAMARAILDEIERASSA